MAEKEGKIYHGQDYKSVFNSKDYLNYVAGELSTFLRFLHDSFSKDRCQSGRLLDLGSGPCIYQIISASRCYTEITCSDFAPKNCQEIEKWRSRDADAFDWTDVLKTVADLEGDSWQTLETRTRNAIKDVIPCDVLQDAPLGPRQCEPFDCVLSTLCLEAACENIQIYMKSVSKTASLIRPGGRLVMAGVLGESYYCFQDKKFFCLKLSKDDVEEALAQAGLSLQDWRHVEYAHASCDVAALFCLTALKMT